MQNRYVVFSLALLFSRVAAGSELAEDLRTPFEANSNPFESISESPLAESSADVLKKLLEKCAFHLVDRQAGSVDLISDAGLRESCAEQISASYVIGKDGKVHVGNRLAIRNKSIVLQIVSWDGSRSDGGDEQAVGVYDFKGNRVAVYPSIFATGNVVDALSSIMGVTIPKEIR